MKRAFALLSLLPFALLACDALTTSEEPAPSTAAAVVVSNDLVISQVYGGGGNESSLFRNDYVELFNRGRAPVSLGGKSLQYAGAKKNFQVVVGAAVADDVALPNVTLAPGKHFLVQLNEGQFDGGLVGGTALPRADFVPAATNAISLSKDKGKIALVPTNALLNGCGAAETPCTPASWIDLVAYGATSLAEGTSVGELSNTTAAVRKNNGCQDTGDNAADFQIAAPAPKTSATAATPCN